jgi:peroxiredoxin
MARARAGHWTAAVAAWALLGGAVGGGTTAHAEPVLPAEPVADFTLPDYRGKEVSLSDYESSPIVVLAVLGTECPLAKLYAGRLVTLQAEFKERGVVFLGINANVQDSLAEMAAYARRHELSFPLLKDVGNRVADALGADRTPEVFVLDDQRHVRYRGRIDDQYGVGYVRNAPDRADLQLALNELLAGAPVSQPVTEAVGCRIGRVRQAQPDAEVTYANQISRLLQKHCVECHREGEIAPFALTEYDEVAGWAEMIQEVVDEGRMPPWHADPSHVPLANARGLSDDEKELLHRWVAAGAPSGDPTQLPPPPTWTQGWQLPREPDFVANIQEEPFVVPAEGEVEYEYFRIDPGFTEDKWVQAVEIQPGNRAVVHHVLMFAGTGNDIVQRFRGGATGYDGGYVPGQRVVPYPEGMARRIDAGSQLIFQVHYTPIGSQQRDQSRVGMLFADPATVRQEVRTSSAVARNLDIPPGAADYRVSASSAPLPHDAQLLAMAPHMHLRGKAFSYEVERPDGTREPLLDIPRYDFNWQTLYLLSEQYLLTKGTRIHCAARFDNSAANLHNPDPAQRVRWGEQTDDEMMIGYFDYAVPKGTPAAGEIVPRGDRVARLFRRLDANGDGRVQRSEIPTKYRDLFQQLDVDGDGELTLQETTRILLLRR